MCRTTMLQAAADRAYEELHKNKPFHNGHFTSWAEQRSDAHPYHFRDGVKIWVADVDVNPDDQFLTQPNASPWATSDTSPAAAETDDEPRARGQQRGG